MSDCEGCFMFRREGRIMFKKNKSCDVITAGKEKNCPCRSCLVKVMCENSCKEYIDYIDQVYKQLNKNKVTGSWDFTKVYYINDKVIE